MAYMIRRARSGNDWTGNELQAYNIAVEYQGFASFFGTYNLPQPTIHPTFLTATDPDEAADDNVYAVLRMMDLASTPSEQDSAVIDFAALLLYELGYASRGRMLRTRKDVPLVICGDIMDTLADMCVKDENEIFFLVQEDKYWGLLDAEAQLIEKAIVAFAANNITRQKKLHPPPWFYNHRWGHYEGHQSNFLQG